MEKENNIQKIPLIGEKFPNFKAVTTFGEKNFPKDYQKKWQVFFSHPADFTPVCTTEFVAFNRRFDEFENLNTQLIGLSVDQVFSHIKWVEWIKDNLDEEIKFPIIADEMGLIAQNLGMIHPKKANSSVRAVFIIDPQSIIRAILYYPQEIGRNIDEILRTVKTLQISDKEKVAMPANWPNNELIKDNVIIPPAQNQKDAKKRIKEFQNYDWWFCYKKL